MHITTLHSCADFSRLRWTLAFCLQRKLDVAAVAIPAASAGEAFQ